jgi:hypothetical protein
MVSTFSRKARTQVHRELHQHSADEYTYHADHLSFGRCREAEAGDGGRQEGRRGEEELVNTPIPFQPDSS